MDVPVHQFDFTYPLSYLKVRNAAIAMSGLMGEAKRHECDLGGSGWR